jgi:hypothetical protein
MTKDSDSNDSPKIQSVTITIAGLLSSAINGIVAYVAVYFFQPLWEKLIKSWNKKD